MAHWRLRPELSLRDFIDDLRQRDPDVTLAEISARYAAHVEQHSGRACTPEGVAMWRGAIAAYLEAASRGR